jgi:hypothetical protein
VDVKRCALRVAALLVLLVVGVRVVLAVDDPCWVTEMELGSGDSSFVVAILTDPHIANPGWRLRSAVDTIMSRRRNGVDIRLVMIAGDLSNGGDTTDYGEYYQFYQVMKRCSIPWIPLTGNHDMTCQRSGVPVVGPQGLFLTRGFHQWFDTMYARLDTFGDSSIHEFERFTDTLWNFEIKGWGTLANDVYQTFAFKAGPSYSPYEFICLDDNTRVIPGT